VEAAVTSTTAPRAALGPAALATGTLALALTLPLWLARFPVAQDLPAHVETAAQIRGLLTGDPATTTLYRLQALPWPNALPTLALAPLLSVVDGLLAAKVLVAVGLVLWPLSLLLLFSRLGRSPWLALLTLPTCLDLSFGYGFLHFIVGKPLWALTLVAAVDAGRQATPRRVLLLCGALIALFHTHLLLFATAAPACLLLVVMVAPAAHGTAPTPRDRVTALLAVVVGAAPALVWWRGVQRHQTNAGAADEPATFLPLGESLARVWTNAGDLNVDVVDGVPWALCAVAFVFVVVDGARQGAAARPGPGAAMPARRDTAALALVTVAVAAFSLLGPVRTAHVSVIAERFVALAVALALGLPAVRLSRRAVVVVFSGAALATAVAVVDVTRHWRAFGARDMGDFDALLAQVPDGARVATHYASALSPHGRHNAAWHWPKLVALRGGVTDDSFAWRATSVVALRPGARPQRSPGLDGAALRGWDFLLVRTAGTAPAPGDDGNDPPADRPAVASDPALGRRLRRLPLSLVASTGTWTLYRVEGAR
jgi:hypothetical protein